MAWKPGDRYQCPDSNCGCAVEVTKGPSGNMGNDNPPRCCCGREMEKTT